MSTKNHSKLLAILFGAVCLVAIVCSFIPFLASGTMGDYFSMEAMGALLGFQKAGKAYLLSGIVVYVGVAYVLVMTVLGSLKKKGVYLWLDAASLLCGVFFVFLLSSYLFFGRKNSGALGMAIVLALLAIVAGILPFLFKGQEKEEIKLVPLPASIPEAKKEPATEKPAEEVKTEEPAEEEKEAEPAQEKKPEPVSEEKPVQEKPEPEPKEEPKPASKTELEKKEEPVEAPKEEEKTQEKSKPSDENVQDKTKKEEQNMKADAKKTSPKAANKVQGKYEVFPEAGFYKYRLKANNGEILIVSNGYKTRDGAKKGIETLKKNVSEGLSKIFIDKKGYAQFRIFTKNDSRLIVAGEFYKDSNSAQSALSSVDKFYQSDKIIDLDEIPENEVREWRIDLGKEDGSDKGKFEIYIDESKKFRGRLLANNGQLLFATAAYTTKAGVTGALEKANKKFSSSDVTITSDKMGRFQFVVYADNGAVLVMGESYPTKDRAISAAKSSKNFAFKPQIIDATKEEE